MMGITLFWFRRDLRLHDNAALYYALKNQKNVQPIFIFDTEILDKLGNKEDARVCFIHQQVKELKTLLNQTGNDVWTFYDTPANVFSELVSQYTIDAVYANHDYEPYAQKRDKQVADLLLAKNIEFRTYKDQCIFEKDEVLKDDGKPYTIFTPYMRKWKQKINPFYLKPYPSQKYFNRLNSSIALPMKMLSQLGFSKARDTSFPRSTVNDNIILHYDTYRDFPALKDGTTKLSVHLRFGTVSIRTLVNSGYKLNEKWLNELIWRDFYMMILWHFPYVIDGAFKPQYNALEWRINEAEFEMWCNGKTGYPIVDAGMRELNQTGFMHNRVRMIVASFLTKHLLIDWRWGEAYFASKLNDYDLSANNGGWQWAAGCGCDAAPYFRIFNPAEQTKKFDSKHDYIKQWVPEYLSAHYPKPIVEHTFARERCLRTYKNALGDKQVVPSQGQLL